MKQRKTTRITMMTNKKSNNRSALKVLYVLPIVGISLAMSAKTVVDYRHKQSTDSIVLPTTAISQQPIPTVGTPDSKGEEVLNVPEKMPEFKGGMSGLMAYLGTNIKYPALAQEIGLSGRVLVRFVIGKQGNVYDIKIAKSAGPENSADYKWKDNNNQPIAGPTGKALEKFQKNYAEANKQLNDEAIRCVESTSGLWTPGTQKGEPVNVQYTIPISFRLQ